MRTEDVALAFQEMAAEVHELLADVAIRGGQAERMVQVRRMLLDMAEQRVVAIPFEDVEVPTLKEVATDADPSG